MRIRGLLALSALYACHPGTEETVARVSQPFAAQADDVLYADGLTDDTAGRFGSDVALRDSFAFVGAPGATAQSFASSGVVYIFDRGSGAWLDDERLEGSDASSGDQLGASVGVSGIFALAGAPGHLGTGAVYAYVETAGAWAEIDKLLAPDSTAGALFGTSVSIDGILAVVGAPMQDEGLETAAGAAYVFSYDGSEWQLEQKLPAPPTLDAGDHFGTSVAIDGDLVVVGAPGEQPGGAAYVYERAGGVWFFDTALDAPLAGTHFGQVVRLRADRALVTAADPASAAPGEARLFQQSGAVWTPTDLNAPTALDGFGLGAALGDDVAFVGAPREVSDAGRVAVFTFAGGGWGYAATLPPTPSTAGVRFGSAMGSDNDLLVGGAPLADGEFGSSIAGRSHALLLFGLACGSSSECALGNCVDDVCCDSACAASCRVCDLAGSEGTCALAPAGHPGAPSCGLYVCDGSEDDCPTSCNGDEDCSQNAYCDGSSCVPKLDPAAPCDDDGACLSGHCVEQICCDSACDRSCGSCTLPGTEGTCSPLAQGQAGEPACEGFVCDGVGLDCPAGCIDDEACPDGMVCHVSVGTCTDQPFCDGGHTLIEPDGGRIDCAPYRCTEPSSCRARCDDDIDCAPGNVCRSDSTCGLPNTPPPPEEDDGCAIAPRGTAPSSPRPREAPWELALAFLALRRRRRV